MDWSVDADARWQQAWATVRQELWQWRRQHPTATFNELEDAVDQQVMALRAQVLADLALASQAAGGQAKQAGAASRCPTCGERLIRQGRHRRRVVVHGNQSVDLDRDYAVCPTCGVGRFPPG